MAGRAPHLYMRVRRRMAAVSTAAPMPRPTWASTGKADGSDSASYWTGPRASRRLPICTWGVGGAPEHLPSLLCLPPAPEPGPQPHHKLRQGAGAIGRLRGPWGRLTVQVGECERLHQALAVTDVHAHFLLADAQVEAFALGDRTGA